MAAGTPALGYWDYVKAAFGWRQKVPLLGHLPINPLALAAFGVLGLANPGFWFLGAAAETAFLLLMAGNERFQKVVEGRRLLDERRVYEARLGAAVARLTAPSQERYARLLQQCKQVVELSQGGASPGDGLHNLRAGGLNQLLAIFLRLLSSREGISQNLSRLERKSLEKEVQRLESQLAEAKPDSPLVRALQGTLEIQRRRLENFDRAQESLQVIDAELERIENQVVLIREEAAVSGKAELLSDRLDSVSNTLRETNRWMEQNAEIIGHLGGDPLDSAPPGLPEIPHLPETEGPAGR